MIIHVSESIWSSDDGSCSIENLARLSGLSFEEIGDLIECGALVPLEQNTEARSIQPGDVATAIAARRLRDDFLLDRHGLSLAFLLLRRIDALKAELALSQINERYFPEEESRNGM